MSGPELYDRLLRYLLPTTELENYDYPVKDPDFPELRKVPLGRDGQKQQMREQFAPSYTCGRCAKVYPVEKNGMPTSSSGRCTSNDYHVHKGELEKANFEGYVETKDKPEKDPNNHGIYALDCEMCYTTYGLELTRVTVIDHKYEVVYEKLVKPTNPILDYNTRFSGIKAGDLDNVTTRLGDVQRDLLEMFSSKSILIGHGLDGDMKALKLFHQRFIDTAHLFPHKRGLPSKRALRILAEDYLQMNIQKGVCHDSKEDASAALRLVMWKAGLERLRNE